MAESVHVAANAVPWTASPRGNEVALQMPIPFVEVRTTIGGLPVIAITIATVVAVSFLSYRFTLTLRDRGWSTARSVIVAQAAALLGLTTFAVTLNPDPYYYIAIARLEGLHGINMYHAPHLVHPGDDDMLGKLLDLYGNPLPEMNRYGPLWTLVVEALARIERDASLGLQYWTQRVLAVFGAAAATLAVLRLFRSVGRIGLERISAFAFHPLVLLETAVNGHNDILMVAAALWAFTLVDEMPLIAGLLMGASIAVKYLTIIVAPFLLARAAQRRWRGAILCFVGTVLVPLICFVPFRPDRRTISGILGGGQMGGDIVQSPTWLLSYPFFAAHHAADKVFPQFPHLPIIKSLTGPSLVSAMMLLFFVIVAGFSLRRYYKNTELSNIWRTLVAFLWACPAIASYYSIWLSPMAAAPGVWGKYAWSLMACALLYYFIPSTLYIVIFLLVPVAVAAIYHFRISQA
jgi:hypothetical protein